MSNQGSIWFVNFNMLTELTNKVCTQNKRSSRHNVKLVWQFHKFAWITSDEHILWTCTCKVRFWFFPDNNLTDMYLPFAFLYNPAHMTYTWLDSSVSCSLPIRNFRRHYDCYSILYHAGQHYLQCVNPKHLPRAKAAPEELFLEANLSRKGANKLKATEGKMYQNAPGYPRK